MSAKKNSSKQASKKAAPKKAAKIFVKKPAPAKKPAAKKAVPAKQKKPATKVAKAVPAKKTAKAKAKPTAKNPAKSVPAKSVKKTSVSKAKPAPKKAAKVSAKKPAPAKKPLAKKAVPAKQKKPATKVAKVVSAKKSVKPAPKTPAKPPVPAKPAKPKNENSKAAATPEKASKNAPTKAEKAQLAGARPLIAPAKRGRKPKASAAGSAATISVPRDVQATSKRLSMTRTRAYTPAELEQLLFQRGTEGINIFNPNAVDVPAKKVVAKKVILKELPKSEGKRTVGAVSVSDLFGFNPFAKDAVSQEESLIPEKWRKYYRKLMARKEELQASISRHSENAFRKEGKEETGDVSAYSQHTADIDNEAFDRDFAISRLAGEQEELAEISIAVERMKNGTYGICEITGKPIPAERLNKVPFTRYSVEGKIEAEKQRRVAARRRRANATGDISEVIDIENDSPISLPEEHEEP